MARSYKKKSVRHRKAQTWREKLLELSNTTWIVSVTGVVIVAYLAIMVESNAHSAASTATENTCGVTTALGSLNTAKQPLAVGAKAPTIGTLSSTTCQTYSLEQYQGNSVVLLEFFATWCPNCQAETQVLNKIANLNSGKGVQVLSVLASVYGRNYEKGDTSLTSMDDVRVYADTFSLSYPALYDPSMKAANTYGLMGGYPTYYLINKQGNITYVGSGQQSYEQLQSEITKALAQ